MAAQSTDLINNANIRRMLDMIAYSEGTANKGDNGYNINFGGSEFDSYADHPRQTRTFTQTDGKTNKTTVSGRYQFRSKTWDGVAKKLGLTDFSPASQDLAAIELIRQRGALQNVIDGDFEGAIAKLGKEWASLPSAPAEYKQPTRSLEDVLTMGGSQAATTAPSNAGQVPTTVIQRDGQQVFALPESGEEAQMMTMFAEQGYDDPMQARLTAALARVNDAKRNLSKRGLFDNLPTELDTQLLELITDIQ